ncbi:hypothetical protein M2165_001004 [Variovorax sp. TBS-050B]|uniref:hypothetical protein n=1 Tax=Variovorax sp. TBS-050B TaxID=2940551 RepID=UPI002477298D|nr:hypothetical protein [Variovorax sp. TBS-050B]MDH6591115.1 hypothetical protein [Variovorax sp. TBS-050B]
MTSRIDKLFEHTKLLCFGRYVLTVPVDSRLSFGRDFPTLPNQAKDLDKIMGAERAKILAEDKTAEITHFGKGPAPNVWLIRSYGDMYAKELELEAFRFYYSVVRTFSWTAMRQRKVRGSQQPPCLTMLPRPPRISAYASPMKSPKTRASVTNTDSPATRPTPARCHKSVCTSPPSPTWFSASKATRPPALKAARGGCDQINEGRSI